MSAHCHQTAEILVCPHGGTGGALLLTVVLLGVAWVHRSVRRWFA